MTNTANQVSPDPALFVASRRTPQVINERALSTLANHFLSGHNATLGIRANNELLIAYRDIKTSNDVRDALKIITDEKLSFDDTGFGTNYQKQLSDGVFELLRNPNNSNAHQKLNELTINLPDQQAEPKQTYLEKLTQNTKNITQRFKPR